MKFWMLEQFKEFYSLINEDELVFKVFYLTAYLTGAVCDELLPLGGVKILRIIIKERLNHSTITTTIDTHGHLLPTRQGKLADKLDGLI